MIRHVFMFNLKTVDALARMERWYWRHHAPEAVRGAGPWLRRYESWRTIAVPEKMPEVGFYNYRWTELWFDGFEPHGSPTGLTWYEGQDEDSDSNTSDAYHGGWPGRFDGPHPVSQVFLPALPDIAVDNHHLPSEAPPTLRWIAMMNFPQDVAAGHKWFVEEAFPKLASMPGAVRSFTSAALEVPEESLREMSPQEPQQFPWHRWCEIRFTDFEAWRAAAPAILEWNAQSRTLHGGMEPYRDFISTIVLEKPDWTLNDVRPFA